jgi:DNA-binding FrmR family transcriptional regulator
MMAQESPNQRKQILTRLRRIEGQVRGLQRIIEEKRTCEEFVQQLSAAKRALDQVGFIVVANRMATCLGAERADDHAKSPELEEAMKLLLKLG